MDIIIIKIMDDIIAYGKKYDAENIENETYKIKERPWDDKIEEKY